MVLIRGKNELQQQQQEQGTTTAAEAGEGTEVCEADNARILAPAAAAEPPQGQCPSALTDGSSNGKVTVPGSCDSKGNNDDLWSYAASALPTGEAFLLVQDINSFKKGCEVYPAAGEQHKQKWKQQQVGYGKGVMGAAADDGSGEAAAAANTESVAAAKL